MANCFISSSRSGSECVQRTYIVIQIFLKTRCQTDLINKIWFKLCPEDLYHYSNLSQDLVSDRIDQQSPFPGESVLRPSFTTVFWRSTSGRRWCTPRCFFWGIRIVFILMCVKVLFILEWNKVFIMVCVKLHNFITQGAAHPRQDAKWEGQWVSDWQSLPHILWQWSCQGRSLPGVPGKPVLVIVTLITFLLGYHNWNWV